MNDNESAINLNTREIFWLNVKRYLALKDISNRTLAKRIDSNESVVVRLMEKKSNIPIESIAKYARALEVQPIDLFEVWTDEEWENMENGGANNV